MTMKEIKMRFIIYAALLMAFCRVSAQGLPTDGNIKVRCHKHRSPLALKDALAQSCNTWFLISFTKS